jgi:serine/threonine-protein kinase RsbW
MNGSRPQRSQRIRRGPDLRGADRTTHGFGHPQPWEGVGRSHVMNRSATVRLELDSRPQSVTLVRAVLSAVAESLGLDAELLNDLKTAVSEACNNVVVHAYGDFLGPLRVEVEVTEAGVTTTVRDHGSGMRNLAARDDGMGVGLAVISALAARAEFMTPPDGGTEVRMWFPIAAAGTQPLVQWEDAQAERAPEAESLPAPDGQPGLELAGDVVVTVSPVSLMTPVLGRLARALAAGARFSFDRFSDVYLVADTIGAHAQRAATGERVSFSLQSAGKRLELWMGPFAEGSGAHFQRGAATDPQDSPLALLADEILVSRAGRSETLHVVLQDRGGRRRDTPH